jgi:hypothetical protein
MHNHAKLATFRGGFNCTLLCRRHLKAIPWRKEGLLGDCLDNSDITNERGKVFLWITRLVKHDENVNSGARERDTDVVNHIARHVGNQLIKEQKQTGPHAQQRAPDH